MTLHIRQHPFIIFNFQENTYRKYNFVYDYKITPHFPGNKEKILPLLFRQLQYTLLKFTNFSI
jgi:hypothetical protein